MKKFLERFLGRGPAYASASHPGRLRANVWRVATSYPFWPVTLAIVWLLGLLAVFDGFHYSAFLFLAFAAYVNAAWWWEIRGWFQRGDICAGAIVSTKPLLVATLTDLTAGEGSYPAVKVRREPVRRWSAAAVKVGAPVASVARYDGARGNVHWSNFHPRAAQCAVADESEVKRLLGEIDKPRWAALEAAIRQLPKPLRPGLYRLPVYEE